MSSVTEIPSKPVYPPGTVTCLDVCSMSVRSHVIFVRFPGLRPAIQEGLRNLILDDHSQEFGYKLAVTVEDLKAAHDCVQDSGISDVRKFVEILTTFTLANEADLVLFDMK